MMYGPDPFGINEPEYYPLPYGGYDPANTPPPGYGDDPSWLDLISQGIYAAQDVARVAVGGHPPGGVYAPVYAPQYPSQQDVRVPALSPETQTQARSGLGFQISTPVLMLGVGGLLLFMLGQRRGR